ncbi:MAG: hypothetical protein QM811_13540 [Pirellulales bacterium]
MPMVVVGAIVVLAGIAGIITWQVNSKSSKATTVNQNKSTNSGSPAAKSDLASARAVLEKVLSAWVFKTKWEEFEKANPDIQAFDNNRIDAIGFIPQSFTINAGQPLPETNWFEFAVVLTYQQGSGQGVNKAAKYKVQFNPTAAKKWFVSGSGG